MSKNRKRNHTGKKLNSSMIEYQNRKIEQSFAPNKPKYVSHNGNFAIQANLPLRTKHNRYIENNERLDRKAINKL